MKCPDCATEMEVQDASAVHGIGRSSPEIAANYFCQECQEYFRWDKGYRLERWAWWEEPSEQQLAHAHIVRTINEAIQ